MKPPRHLYTILALGVLCIASSSILIRYISGEASGLTVATYRTVLAALFLLPFSSRVWPEIKALPSSHKGMIGFSGVLLGLHFVTWISSLYYTTVASS
ncbi:MAG TPA: EamA/RhaT family transporter, partial [Bacteroidetes bacterium]|nr:EamA/RhaT family transporter [Bacteroidota bacterium]